MNAKETVLYQQGFLEGASTQRERTAINVFAYIIDHDELIPEELCLEMCSKFLKDTVYNTIV